MIRRVTRREFVRMSGLGATAVAVGAQGLSDGSAAAVRFPSYPFTLGVASGDPEPDGVVLWTRLAPDPLNDPDAAGMPPTPVAVEWEVAADPGMRQVVKRGVAKAVPELAHSVHVEVHGLAPAREYFYRFKAGPEISPVGRTRTAPAPRSRPDRLRFAVASCQQWVGGGYAAYRNMVDEDLDLVLHLGDYTYENSTTRSLADYRALHALYKTSPDLQAAHAAFPFVVVFDDHDVEDNWAGDTPKSPDPDFLTRRANAFQAYYEHLPLRARARPDGADMLLYRRFTYGDLAELSVLDTRQYRDDQACGDGRKEPCPEMYDENRTVMGPDQERWLLDGLTHSTAKWNVIAQQIVMAEFDYDPGPGVVVNLDQWDGYPAARDRFLSGIAGIRPSNPVVLSGDWHSSWVNDLKADFAAPDSETLATEFVGTSVSSGAPWSPDVEKALPANPHVKFFNGTLRGYLRCEVSRDQWRTDIRAVSNASDSQSPVSTLASFVVEDGTPGAVRIPGVEITGITSDVMIGGRANQLQVAITNSTDTAVEVTAAITPPPGWSSDNSSVSVAPLASATLELPITPPADRPGTGMVEVLVTAGNAPIFGPPTRLQLVSVPSGDDVLLALDSGGPSTPVLATYQRLSPLDRWDPAKGYGWLTDVGFRDRGKLDALRRDFTLSRGEPSVLRLAVPAGRHAVRLLTGDASFASGNTMVRIDGSLVAESGDDVIPEGQFRWIDFEVDGGADGRELDLEITGDLREGYWRICALILQQL
jgi:alkaline phosphatase D